MTLDRSTRIERSLPGLFDQLAEARTPDYLEAAIERASSRPQRPAWTYAGRWLPVELTTTRVPATRASIRAFGVLLLIAVLIAAALAVYVGTHQTRLPAPFGVAANGVIAYVTPGGDVAVADPATGKTDVLVADPEQVRAPAFSLDGTRVAYERIEADGATVMVVDIGERSSIEVAAIPDVTDSIQWSPDGSKLALISGKQVWIANSDGSGARALDIGMDVQDEIEWRPPDGTELVVRGERNGEAALYLIALDGSQPRPITPVTTGEFDYLWLTWAPDGSRVAYSNAHPHEVHIIDVDRGTDTELVGDTGVGLMFPRWSPDGARLAVMTWLSDSPPKVQVGVVPADDPSPHVTLTGPTFSNGIQHDWAPDGRSILATEWGTSQPWLLDPAGGPGRQQGWSASFPDWVEWQRLAP